MERQTGMIIESSETTALVRAVDLPTSTIETVRAFSLCTDLTVTAPTAVKDGTISKEVKTLFEESHGQISGDSWGVGADELLRIRMHGVSGTGQTAAEKFGRAIHAVLPQFLSGVEIIPDLGEYIQKVLDAETSLGKVYRFMVEAGPPQMAWTAEGLQPADKTIQRLLQLPGGQTPWFKTVLNLTRKIDAPSWGINALPALPGRAPISGVAGGSLSDIPIGRLAAGREFVKSWAAFCGWYSAQPICSWAEFCLGDIETLLGEWVTWKRWQMKRSEGHPWLSGAVDVTLIEQNVSAYMNARKTLTTITRHTLLQQSSTIRDMKADSLFGSQPVKLLPFMPEQMVKDLKEYRNTIIAMGTAPSTVQPYDLDAALTDYFNAPPRTTTLKWNELMMKQTHAATLPGQPPVPDTIWMAEDGRSTTSRGMWFDPREVFNAISSFGLTISELSAAGERLGIKPTAPSTVSGYNSDLRSAGIEWSNGPKMSAPVAAVITGVAVVRTTNISAANLLDDKYVPKVADDEDNVGASLIHAPAKATNRNSAKWTRRFVNPECMDTSAGFVETASVNLNHAGQMTDLVRAAWAMAYGYPADPNQLTDSHVIQVRWAQIEDPAAPGVHTVKYIDVQGTEQTAPQQTVLWSMTIKKGALTAYAEWPRKSGNTDLLSVGVRKLMARLGGATVPLKAAPVIARADGGHLQPIIVPSAEMRAYTVHTDFTMKYIARPNLVFILRAGMPIDRDMKYGATDFEMIWTQMTARYAAARPTDDTLRLTL